MEKELNVCTVLDTAIDNAGVYLEPAVKQSFLQIIRRGVFKEDSVRKLRCVVCFFILVFFFLLLNSFPAAPNASASSG